jgi:glucosamine 6-phosphate synthetase-like amidotransferase/phosphosugar isomerase protein
MVFGRRQRTKDELDYLGKVFTYLLLLSEQRGPHATGVAWLKAGGKHRIFKQPQKARDFFRNDAFRGFLDGIDPSVTWLVGHTRWQTVGDASNNLNNHPILAGDIIGTHNGTITNADSLFAHFGLPRSAEVDSELIFRLAHTALVCGHIDVAAFKSRLALCKGEISAVMASRRNPGEVVLIKGNKPLEIRYNKMHEVVIYTSDSRYLDLALAGQRGWKPIHLSLMTIATIDSDCLSASTCESFKLANSIGRGRF